MGYLAWKIPDDNRGKSVAEVCQKFWAHIYARSWGKPGFSSPMGVVERFEDAFEQVVDVVDAVVEDTLADPTFECQLEPRARDARVVEHEREVAIFDERDPADESKAPELELDDLPLIVVNGRWKEVVAHCVAASKLKFGGASGGLVEDTPVMRKTVWAYLNRYLVDDHKLVKGQALRIIQMAVPLVFVQTREERAVARLERVNIGRQMRAREDGIGLLSTIAEVVVDGLGLHWTSRLLGVSRPGAPRG